MAFSFFGCLYNDEVSLFALANEVSGVCVLCSELGFIQPVLSESYGYKSSGLRGNGFYCLALLFEHGDVPNHGRLQ